jgi:prolyl oligopeptidase
MQYLMMRRLARALAGAALVSCWIWHAALAVSPTPGRPPPAAIDRTTDTYFGKTIADPYRWMETPSSAFDAWAHAQDDVTRATLARIPGRDALRRHMDEIAGKMTVVTAVTPIGHRIFFRRQDAGDDLAKLVVRDTDTGRDHVLLDPNRVVLGGHHIAIDQFQPSQDGHYVAVGVAPAGSEEDVLAVLDADTGRRLPDSIDRARFASVSWLPDGRSFAYNRLRPFAPHDRPADRFTYQKVFIHHLGANPSADVPIFGAGVSGVTTVAPTDFVAVAAILGTRYALGIQNDGVSPEISLYVSPIPAGDTGYRWQRIATADVGIVDVAADRDTLFFRSHLNAPRYQVISVPLDKPDLKAARVVVPQGDGVLTNIAVSSDALYVAARNGAISTVLRVGADGRAVKIKLPIDGSIAPPEEGPGSLTADPRAPGAVVGIDTWVTPTAYFGIDRAGVDVVGDLGLAPRAMAPDGYVITETSVLAKDGRTRLPLSIIEKKGTPHDNRQPVLVEGYGAYGISEEPFARFVPAVRGWVDAGGVLAIAHVRGGGELGEAWHLAGKKVTKQNSIHDFIDCAWWMTQLGYASPATLAGMGTSAGGITIGGAITQMPSLFRAALIRVGSSNPLREEFTEGGPANIPEFGTVGIQADFNALLAMDAYQHVQQGVPYPAVLLTGGAQDHRVPLWEPAKMAARLQADSGRAKGPTLLRVEYEGGHGTIGAGQKQADAEWADGFSFLLWQMGVAGYQPAP